MRNEKEIERRLKEMTKNENNNHAEWDRNDHEFHELHERNENERRKK